MIQIQQFCVRGVVWIRFVLYLLKVFLFLLKNMGVYNRTGLKDVGTPGRQTFKPIFFKYPCF